MTSPRRGEGEDRCGRCGERVKGAGVVGDWASKTLRVGIVGLGWTGWTHLKAYQELPNVEVVALAGYEADRLAQYGREFNVPNLYREYQDLLARDDLDVVSVCTPNQLHAPVAIGALAGGRHVVCEKPLARSSTEALAMVEAARKADRVLHTIFNHRERGDVVALKRYIDEGGLGRIYHAKASWMRRNGIPTLGSWFTNKEMAGGGPLIDLGVHMLDLALYLTGEPQIATVSAATYAELGPRGRGNRVETFAAKHSTSSQWKTRTGTSHTSVEGVRVSVFMVITPSAQRGMLMRSSS